MSTEKENSIPRQFTTLCGRTLRNTDPQYFPRAQYRGRTIYFCTESCLGAFLADPDLFYKAHRKSKNGNQKMTNPHLWKTGDNVLLRGVYDGRPVNAHSTRVVKDTPEETALLIWPGAECIESSGYIRYGHNTCWDRWTETLTNTLQMERCIWHTNRFLILLEPEKFYSTIYIWNAASHEFICYYINFQLPFRRTPLGFDTLDLDLDIVIEASRKWKWKDEEEYQHGIRSGGIRPEWVKEIEYAQDEVFTRIEQRTYPLNDAWLSWRPDLTLPLPYLPKNWDQVIY